MDFKQTIDALMANNKLNVQQKSDQLKHYFDNLDDNDPQLDEKKQYINKAAKNLKELINSGGI
jgi:translation initiation factor RLI1